jgi:hypothetical protein
LQKADTAERRMIMCNALILGMLAMLVFHTEMENSVLFWIYWVLAIVANTNWWRKIESKLTKGE